MALVQSIHDVLGLSIEPIRNESGYIARTLSIGAKQGFVFELSLFAKSERALQLPAERAASELLAACTEVLRCASLPNDWAASVRAAITRAEAHMSAQLILATVAGKPEFECSLSDFLAANSDALEAERIDELTAALSRGEVYRIGGGAAPIIEIRNA